MAIAGNQGVLGRVDRVAGMGQAEVGKNAKSNPGSGNARVPGAAPKADFASQLAEPQKTPPQLAKQSARQAPTKTTVPKSTSNKAPTKELKEGTKTAQQPVQNIEDRSETLPHKPRAKKGESTTDSSKESPKEISENAEGPSKQPTRESKSTRAIEGDGQNGSDKQPQNLKTELKSLPVVALLTGHLEALDPQEITQLIAENGFVKNALLESDLVGFFEKPMETEKLLTDLGISEEIIQGLRMNGVDLSGQGTPLQLFKAIGIDALQVRSELSVLKDNLSLGTIGDYLKRAQILSQLAPQAGAYQGAGMMGGIPGKEVGTSGPASPPQGSGEQNPSIFIESDHIGPGPNNGNTLGRDRDKTGPQGESGIAPQLSGNLPLGNMPSQELAPPTSGKALAPLNRRSGVNGISASFGGGTSPVDRVKNGAIGGISGVVSPGMNDGAMIAMGLPGEILGGLGGQMAVEPPLYPYPIDVAQGEGMASPEYRNGELFQPTAQGATYDHWFEIGKKIVGQNSGISELGLQEDPLKNPELNLDEIAPQLQRMLADNKAGLSQKVFLEDHMIVGENGAEEAMQLKNRESLESRISGQGSLGAQGSDTFNQGKLTHFTMDSQLHQDLPVERTLEQIRAGGGVEPSITSSQESGGVKGARDFMGAWTGARQAMEVISGFKVTPNNPSVSITQNILQPTMHASLGVTEGLGKVMLSPMEPLSRSSQFSRDAEIENPRDFTESLQAKDYGTEMILAINERGDGSPLGINGSSKSDSQNQSNLGQSGGFKDSMSSLERAKWVQKIFDGAHMLMTQGGGQIRLSMPQTPWGSLDIALQMTNQKLDIRVMAGDEGVREALVGELGQLGEQLAARRIELGKVEVGFSGIASQLSHQNSKEGSQQSSDQKFKDHAIHQDWLKDMRSAVKITQLNNLKSMSNSGIYRESKEPNAIFPQSSINKFI